jgi:hypothetical protein
MWKRMLTWGGLGALLSLIPTLALAAGDKAEALIVVADTRVLTGIHLYFADLYNENMWLFAVWSVVLTTFLGVVLGAIMDIVMKATGIDLTKRSIVEH